MAHATPNTDACIWHMKYPLKNNWETYDKWMARVKKEDKAREDAAKKQAKSDAKIAARGVTR
jgi:hypothetical protein